MEIKNKGITVLRERSRYGLHCNFKILQKCHTIEMLM